MRPSYVARYKSNDPNKCLLGAVKSATSSRWGEKRDAETFLAAAIANNGPHCVGTVETYSDHYPEIFRHCPEPDKPAQAIGGRCFTCGKVLTKEDAIEFANRKD